MLSHPLDVIVLSDKASGQGRLIEILSHRWIVITGIHSHGECELGLDDDLKSHVGLSPWSSACDRIGVFHGPPLANSSI